MALARLLRLLALTHAVAHAALLAGSTGATQISPRAAAHRAPPPVCGATKKKKGKSSAAPPKRGFGGGAAPAAAPATPPNPLDESWRGFEGWLESESVASAVALADCGGGLRGVQTTKATKAGAELLRVPRALILDDARADASPVGKLWADAAAPVPAYLRIALLLLHEARLGDASPLAQYVAMLPTAAEFAAEGGPAALWTDDELALLECPKLAGDAQSRRRLLEEHPVVAPPAALAAKWSELGLPGASPTADELAWAVAAVTSRAYGADEGGRSISMLIPMVDMANHASPPNTAKGLDDDGDAFVVVAAEKLAKGDEVYLSYGPLPNLVLLLQFGFVLPGSDTDFALVDCGPLLEKCGAAADGAAALAAQADRGLLMREKDGAVSAWQPGGAQLRAAVEALAAAGRLGDEDGRAAYLDLVKRTLLAFGTSADDDKRELKEGGKAMAPRTRLALTFRREQKLLLRREFEAAAAA